MTAYAVDVDELVAVIASMDSCGHDLADLAADLETHHSSLHAEWTGLASEAHAGSHGQWRKSFAEITSALAGLRALSDTARANYTSAVEANLAMWEQVR